MLVVACYDIANNRRRVRVSKVLLSFGERVQESVYEAHVDGGQWKRMVSRVQALIKSEDRVCFYQLCATCQARTLVTEGQPRATAPVPCVVVLGKKKHLNI